MGSSGLCPADSVSAAVRDFQLHVATDRRGERPGWRWLRQLVWSHIESGNSQQSNNDAVIRILNRKFQQKSRISDEPTTPMFPRK